MNEERAQYLELIQGLLEKASIRELHGAWQFLRAYLGKPD